jgi:hypothetical protein
MRRWFVGLGAPILAAGGALAVSAGPATAAPVTLFSSTGTGAPVTAPTVPPGICFVTIEAAGGSGGGDRADLGVLLGGTGAHVRARVPVVASSTLDVFVGGAGGSSGGVGGGGGGGFGYAGGGGGASSVSTSGTPLLVAGGGGGGVLTPFDSTPGTVGGDAGAIGENGAKGDGTDGGSGGTATGVGGSGGTNGGGGGGVVAGAAAAGNGGAGGDGNGSAGGGGGGSRSGTAGTATGGDAPGTGTPGTSASAYPGGTGVTPGGNGGAATDTSGFGGGGGGGALGIGGGGGGFSGGGGGSGYGGGGGGGGDFDSAGGGGSSYAVPGATQITDLGGNRGNGLVNITYDEVADACLPPSTKPGAPTDVHAGASASGTANVSFAPPADPGSTPVSAYQARCGGVNKGGFGSPILVTGLTNGVPITCKVRARNDAGFGPFSTEVPFTPGVPWGPTSVTGGPGPVTGSVVVNWNAAQTNGAPITKYVVTCQPWTASFPTRSVEVGGAKRTAQVNGLQPDAAHNCTLVAWNSRGPGNPRNATPIGLVKPRS